MGKILKPMSKFKRLLINGLAFLNTFEGVIHLVVAVIGYWGLYDTGLFDWRLFVAPTENLIFGVFSIVTGHFLKELGHHHKH